MLVLLHFAFTHCLTVLLFRRLDEQRRLETICRKTPFTPSLRDGVFDDGLVCYLGLFGTTPKGKSIVAKDTIKHPMVSELGTHNIHPSKLK